MIQLLSHYQKGVARFFLIIFYLSATVPSYARGGGRGTVSGYIPSMPGKIASDKKNDFNSLNQKKAPSSKRVLNPSTIKTFIPQSAEFIDGPSQPEMSSFKSVGTDNMVNLFTGDFSYNIPLLDVGGYPVNIFYSGSPSAEQEASWVGLGWNINPGTINRNMRGVPDDFNGEDMLIEQQAMKPNKTWGARLGPDFEFVGFKNLINGSFSASLGVSFNNYLGPAIDLGVKGGINFNIGKAITSEKDTGIDTLGFPFKPSLLIDGNLSSREGLTLSPTVSFTAMAFKQNVSASTGLSLSTSYNSRSGIKNLQLSDQMSLSRYATKENASGKDEVIKDNKLSFNENMFSSAISFTKPSYLPVIRMPLTNTAFSGHFQLGGGIFGGYASDEIEMYFQKAEIESANMTQQKPLVGYMYYQNAMDNPNAVMDFTRFNDKEVTGKTPVISAPQYTYDVFSIHGEGTGGSIRAYRNDLGYVRDNNTRSQDKSLSLGVDVGPPGHYGANFNSIKTPTEIGEWSAGNKLRTGLKFSNAAALYENVYFRNPGESSVLNKDQYANIGGTDLVRFELGGTPSSSSIEPVLDHFYKTGKINPDLKTNILSSAISPERNKRTQVINFLTADEASKVGLDKVIKNYNSQTILDQFADTLKYLSISRVSDYRKAHHISQINVTESDGKRYLYGIPVYNIKQQDFTFSVKKTDDISGDDDKVDIQSAWMNTTSPFINSNTKTDPNGYVQITQTPAYAHSFLLSGLLSPDYVDVTGNGITEDDLGNAVKFNYSLINQVHKWRTPLGTNNEANFNAGNRSEIKDDKGIVSYGERESWYLHSIESKTMIAIFTLEDRNDGKGARDSLGGINQNDNSLKLLRKIDLYNKSDLKANGIAQAKPVKTVHFDYSYKLCEGTPDNYTPDNTLGQGKLKLESIYFTFNGQTKQNKNLYKFTYANNKNYEFNVSDRWGTFKKSDKNPGSLKNKDYPYSLQETQFGNPVTKTEIDENASAWSLDKILLPSGGQIEVEYEADDYAFVQNRRAADMMQIVGFGSTSTYSASSNRLYNVPGADFKPSDNNYVFIRVSESCSNLDQLYKTYLEGITQFAFRYAVKMPKGEEYLTSYANLDDVTSGDPLPYGLASNNVDNNIIWIRLKSIDDYSPLSLTALEYLREQLPGQAFKGYDVSETSGLKRIGDMLMGMLDGLANAFADPIKVFRSEGKAQIVNLSKCFIRLNDPKGHKYGGGNRVKSVKLKDNWQAMTGQYNSVYEQVYDYSTTEIFNGEERTISSGVASYEPSTGGEENPFQTIVQVADKLPLGPASYGSVEMPILDAFFPAASVGYSKVTVRSIPGTTVSSAKKSRSGVGKQVTEFYTARDFPVYYSHTAFDPSTDKQEHVASTLAFFYKYAFDSRALSQGFLIETNDMHGKLKSQSSYAENDENTRINYTENFYRNTGSKGLDEKFDFVYGSKGGSIEEGNMGVDIELMTDAREFSVKSGSLEVQGQLDLFPIFFPIWVPFIWPVGGNSENTYRAVTTTKVINYHSILDSVVVIDKGSSVSTRNLVYDAETGGVIVNRTNNEFNQPIYTTNYPAYWTYSGMGLAYKNIDALYSGASFSDGRITIPGVITADLKKIFESGDELLILNQSDPASGCDADFKSEDQNIIWAFDTSKNTSSLTNTTPYFIFLDTAGKPFTKTAVRFRIIRSGKRNMLSANVAGITTMISPIVIDAADNTKQKLFIGNASNAVNASSVEYKEKWQVDKDVIKTFTTIPDPNNQCNTIEVESCDGYLEKSINPYRKGLIGNFRAYRNLVFYGERKETRPVTPAAALNSTNLSVNGFLDNFKLYWDFNAVSNLIPDITNQDSKWVWNNQSTRFNSHGLELETKNALNIYTAAQYGYANSLPVAVTNNSEYSEAAFAGFEDEFYRSSLDDTTSFACADKKHFNLTLTNTGNIINSQSININAHSGKYILGINSTNSLINNLKVIDNNIDSFNIKLNTNTLKSLNEVGGNIEKLEDNPAGNHNLNYSNYYKTGGNGNLFMKLDIDNRVSAGPNVDYGYYFKTFQFFEIGNGGNYIFDFTGTTERNEIQPNDDIHMNLTVEAINIKETPQYEIIFEQRGNDQNYHSQRNYCLKKGIYKVTCESIHKFRVKSEMQGGTTFWEEPSDIFSLSIGNDAPISYKSLSQSNCIFTSPLAANDSMLNPTFSILKNKKMLFSAWVREDCTTGNCPPIAYTNSQVKIEFNSGSNSCNRWVAKDRRRIYCTRRGYCNVIKLNQS